MNSATFRDILTEVYKRERSEIVKRKAIADVAEEYGKRIYNSTIGFARVEHGKFSMRELLSSVGVGLDWLENEFKNNDAEYGRELSETTTEKTSAVAAAEEPSETAADARARVALETTVVPEKMSTFVKTQNYRTVERVVKSGTFFPVFITGPSGNGKSLSIMQAAAHANRAIYRINVTAGTEESDLIGNWSLINGNTVWQDGPVTAAMRTGSLLLIDEIDMLNPNKAASLFTVLEGNGVYIKKTNEFIRPEAGFNVFATANTKGKGSDDGRYMGTNILNEAFLERFPIMLEYDYPTKSQETKIVSKALQAHGIEDEDVIESFTKSLVDWASIIRKGFNEGSVEETISTRRLVHIVKAFSIFEDRLTAIKMATNRFDDEIKESFVDLYTKIDAGAIAADEDGNEISQETAAAENNTTDDGDTEPAF